jgi:LmbE family N-acetylglucosaminyl deacetylase
MSSCSRVGQEESETDTSQKVHERILVRVFTEIFHRVLVVFHLFHFLSENIVYIHHIVSNCFAQVAIHSTITIMKKMLLSLAHPDDESFGSGIMIPKYVANGWQVHLITATLGEAGESGPYDNLSGKALGGVRKTELDKAASILGISGITHLSYRDGKLQDQVDGELEDILYKKMVELTPDIVVTFDTRGVSNHPDHVKMCYATTFSFQRYADELIQTRQFVSDVNSGKPNVNVRNFAFHHKYALKQQSFADTVKAAADPKLYYISMPESVALYLRKMKVIPEESFGLPMVGTPDKIITTVIEGSKYQSVKRRALEAHVSQSNNTVPYLNLASNPMLTREYFILRMQGITEVFMGKNDRVSDRL